MAMVEGVDVPTALLALSGVTSLTMEELLSLYLVLKDDLFFVLDILQGKTVKFPSSRQLRASFKVAGGDYVALSLVRESYLVGGVQTPSESLSKGDVIYLDGSYLECLSTPTVFFGRRYILCKRVVGGFT